MANIETIIAFIISSLLAAAFFMIKNWHKNWEATLSEHDKRLGNHDIQLATITANMEHIKTTGDETRVDVKRLLGRQANDSRSAS